MRLFLFSLGLGLALGSAAAADAKLSSVLRSQSGLTAEDRAVLQHGQHHPQPGGEQQRQARGRRFFPPDQPAAPAEERHGQRGKPLRQGRQEGGEAQRGGGEQVQRRVARQGR